MDGKERNLIKGLGWGSEIVQLVDPYIPFNSLSEYGVSGVKQRNYINNGKLL